MTARELRQILTAVEKQDLTVKELRAILFEIKEQDAELTDGQMIRITSENEGKYRVTSESFIVGIFNDRESAINKIKELIAEGVDKLEIILYSWSTKNKGWRVDNFRTEIETAETEKPGTYLYTPEMGQEKPNCQMEARLSYYGRHYIVDTPLELKGRGITQRDTHWVEGCQKQIEGWKSYQVTYKAFEKLQSQYSIAIVSHLD